LSNAALPQPTGGVWSAGKVIAVRERLGLKAAS
jgi:hypothetical protein